MSAIVIGFCTLWIVLALFGIDRQLSRIADALEGKKS